MILRDQAEFTGSLLDVSHIIGIVACLLGQSETHLGALFHKRELRTQIWRESKEEKKLFAEIMSSAANFLSLEVNALSLQNIFRLSDIKTREFFAQNSKFWQKI